MEWIALLLKLAHIGLALTLVAGLIGRFVVLSRAADKYYARYYAQTGDPYYATVLAVRAACESGDVDCGAALRDQLAVEDGLLHNMRDPNCDSRCRRLALEVAGYGDIVTVIDAAKGAGVTRVGVITEGMRREAAGGA